MDLERSVRRDKNSRKQREGKTGEKEMKGREERGRKVRGRAGVGERRGQGEGKGKGEGKGGAILQWGRNLPYTKLPWHQLLTLYRSPARSRP